MKEIQELMKEKEVVVTTADQCMYGLKAWSTNKAIKDTKAQQKTGFMTNSAYIADEPPRRCDKRHKHQVLTNGRAKDAATYPVGRVKP